MVLVLSLYWDCFKPLLGLRASFWSLYYLRLQTVALPAHGYLRAKTYCLRRTLTSSVSCWQGVFRIRVSREKASVRGKASSYIIASVKTNSTPLCFCTSLHWFIAHKLRLRRSILSLCLLWGSVILEK